MDSKYILLWGFVIFIIFEIFVFQTTTLARIIKLEESSVSNPDIKIPSAEIYRYESKN